MRIVDLLNCLFVQMVLLMFGSTILDFFLVSKRRGGQVNVNRYLYLSVHLIQSWVLILEYVLFLLMLKAKIIRLGSKKTIHSLSLLLKV